MEITVDWCPNGRVLPSPSEREIMTQAAKDAAERLPDGANEGEVYAKLMFPSKFHGFDKRDTIRIVNSMDIDVVRSTGAAKMSKDRRLPLEDDATPA